MALCGFIRRNYYFLGDQCQGESRRFKPRGRAFEISTRHRSGGQHQELRKVLLHVLREKSLSETCVFNSESILSAMKWPIYRFNPACCGELMPKVLSLVHPEAFQRQVRRVWIQEVVHPRCKVCQRSRFYEYGSWREFELYRYES